jgi:hypothetical protein
MKMKVKQLVAAGIVTAILCLALDMVLGAGGGLIAQACGVPLAQPSGIETKIKFGLIFEVVNGFMLAVIYAIIHPSLPGGRRWQKGLSYGLLVWGLRVVMWAFSTYMMTDMPPILIVITVITGLIEVLILGIVIAAIYRSANYDN